MAVFEAEFRRQRAEKKNIERGISKEIEDDYR